MKVRNHLQLGILRFLISLSASLSTSLSQGISIKSEPFTATSVGPDNHGVDEVVAYLPQCRHRIISSKVVWVEGEWVSEGLVRRLRFVRGLVGVRERIVRALVRGLVTELVRG